MSSQDALMPSPFPAQSKTANKTVASIPTTATAIFFTDKILITISQGGRLAQWVHVPLDGSLPEAHPLPPEVDPESDAPPSDLLPMSHLTATTVLGGTVPERDTLGQLLATQIASAIATKDTDEKRMVVVGLGLEKSTLGREEFMDLVELVLGII
ncbi:hypothetical protein EJ06DRAFT_533378 [Trichodelitschia bisporula]|uniref:Proteasome assembly chaperone 3 n=1 Tax=Trichodelitschia bisporula TaxID=703511 RepID=A0A6G1HMX4_9PEZI|nr:hypothetical protein EJ06DRAFT_533378 [Trichodelitschia bisporula]